MGPVSESASDLRGTSAVGFGITDPIPALNVSLNEPVVDIPAVNRVGVQAATVPALDAWKASDVSSEAPTFVAAPLPTADLRSLSSPALDTSIFSGSTPSFDVASLDTGSFGGFGGFRF